MSARKKTLAERFFALIEPCPTTGCWLWIGPVTGKGYGRLKIDWRQRGNIYAHRLSWEIHKGAIPDGLSVLHVCDVSACVNPAHLFLGTISDNHADMYRKGRGPNVVLKPADVLAIRASPLRDGATAKQYGVSRNAVRDVRKRLTWDWVEEQHK